MPADLVVSGITCPAEYTPVSAVCFRLHCLLWTDTSPILLCLRSQCLTLMPNRSGTSDTDYTTAEDAHDDGERWGGERLGKVLRDEGAADVLLVCSRWFGGTLIGVRYEGCTGDGDSG